jgi:hypothetical protein
MAEVQEKQQTHDLTPEGEKVAGLSEHKEVAATPEKTSSEDEVQRAPHDDPDHFDNHVWTWKDRAAALSLSGLYVGE